MDSDFGLCTAVLARRHADMPIRGLLDLNGSSSLRRLRVLKPLPI